MKVTLGKDEAEAATGNPATVPVVEGDPDLARARDGHRTPDSGDLADPLPVTHRNHRRGSGAAARAAETGQMIWSGEVWDVQPPSPRELVDRARDGEWWDHEAAFLRFLARAGVVVCIAWSVPLYTLAVLGHRPGRALTALLTAGLIWYLI